MPCVRIATGVWAIGSEMKLIEAVQSALVAAFKILENGKPHAIEVLEHDDRPVSIGLFLFAHSAYDHVILIV